MTPEAQNIAIAKALGKEFHRPTAEEIKSGSYYQYEPDYTRDLNAMHEAEKVLRAKRFTFAIYRDWLLKICNPQCDPLSKEWTDEENENAISATAAQRAEAFLKTLNLWRD